MIRDFTLFNYWPLKVRKTFTTDPEIMPEVLPIETVSNGSCRDTYKMVMFTDTFCDEWIEEAEWENNWFASGNHEVRISSSN